MSEQPGGPVSTAEARVPVPLAVVVVVGAVVVALLLVAGAVWISTPRLSTGPEADPPPAAVVAATRIDYDRGSRKVSVDKVRMVLPAAPYDCADAERAEPPLFTSLATCSVLVHEDYNAKGDDWYGNVGFGIVDAGYVEVHNPGGTAQKVFTALRTAFFTDQKTTAAKLARPTLDLGRPTGVQTGEIGYRISGLDSRFDRLIVIAVELESGEMVVFFSARPDDTPTAARTVLDEAINSLTAV